MALAFIAPPPAIETKAKDDDLRSSRDGLPVFRRRWWHRRFSWENGEEILDGRPVAWSLDHRPEDWKAHETDRQALVHIPSGHRFGFYGGKVYLTDTNPDQQTRCGCGGINGSQRNWHLGHQKAMTKAFRRWHYYNTPTIREHFASHFVR